MKEQLKVLTCGSVDDGKSTLIGHLIYNSKKLYTDQIKSLELENKIKKNNTIDYSLLLDGLDEEREQKITIDVAYRYFFTDKKKYTILDTPGHEEYTRNMAVGASQADLAIILIDATKGILTQTKRHINICLMMGIKDYIIAINKMDLIDYNEEKYEQLKKQIEEIFDDKKIFTLKIIPVSATIGDNLNTSSKNMNWYKEESLMQYLENIKIKEKNNNNFILPIQRVSRPNQNFRGFQGNVSSGKIKINDKIICYPSKEETKIKKLYNLNKKVEKVECGQAVTITLDREIDVSRGCVITNDNNIRTSNNINVTMLWLEEENLKINTAYYLSIGTKNTLCYIRKINYKIDINNKKKIISNVISNNEIVNCDIEVLEKIAVTEFEYNKTLGSLILINRISNATSSCAIVNEIIENENIFKYNSIITKEERKQNLHQTPITIWFTGLSCSGKSTIASELEKILIFHGFHTMHLDGDNIRLGLNKDLSFSSCDRIENIRRVAEVAKILNDAGIICISSFITPLEINREMAKKIIGDNFILIYINTSIKECEKRDKKGLYQKAKQGIIKDFTGINSPFEIPISCDMIINNDNYEEAAIKIYEYIIDKIKTTN